MDNASGLDVIFPGQPRKIRTPGRPSKTDNNFFLFAANILILPFFAQPKNYAQIPRFVEMQYY